MRKMNRWVILIAHVAFNKNLEFEGFSLSHCFPNSSKELYLANFYLII